MTEWIKTKSSLTDRQVTKILGSTIALLLSLADEEAVKNAMLWWISNWSRATAVLKNRMPET
jgi:hypothetical protein